jgi:hypothetical protein
MPLAPALSHCDPQDPNSLTNFTQFAIKYRSTFAPSASTMSKIPSKLAEQSPVHGVSAGRLHYQVELKDDAVYHSMDGSGWTAGQ